MRIWASCFFFLSACLSISSLNAQDEGPGGTPDVDSSTKAKEDPQQNDLKGLVDATESEFRDVVCQHAANGEPDLRDVAISIAQQNGYTDKRFDAVVFKSLRDAAHAERPDPKSIKQTLTLMPLTTLDTETKLTLVLDCYVAIYELSERTSILRNLRSVINLFPEESQRLIRKQIKGDEFPRGLLELLNLNDPKVSTLLPELINGCKSNDPKRAAQCLETVATIIANLKRQLAIRQTDQKGPVIEQTDERFIRFAERIIGRYDKNGDSNLDQEETQAFFLSGRTSFLLNEVDVNGDGSVSLSEFAWYLQTASRARAGNVGSDTPNP